MAGGCWGCSAPGGPWSRGGQRGFGRWEPGGRKKESSRLRRKRIREKIGGVCIGEGSRNSGPGAASPGSCPANPQLLARPRAACGGWTATLQPPEGGAQSGSEASRGPQHQPISAEPAPRPMGGALGDPAPGFRGAGAVRINPPRAGAADWGLGSGAPGAEIVSLIGRGAWGCRRARRPSAEAAAPYGVSQGAALARLLGRAEGAPPFTSCRVRGGRGQPSSRSASLRALAPGEPGSWGSARRCGGDTPAGPYGSPEAEGGIRRSQSRGVAGCGLRRTAWESAAAPSS